MAATRNTPPDTGDAPTSGLTDEDRKDIAQMIADAVAGGKAPTASTDDPKGPKPVTDSEWDLMPDRQREKWVRELVDFRLDELARDDDQRQLAAKVAALEDKKPEPEATPSVVSKLQKFLWGDDRK